MSERILLIGSGGREHALAWKLSVSKCVEKIFVSPGNAGTSNFENASNVALNVKDFEAVSLWCQENHITLVVVGPEDPLAAGIVDFLSKKGIPCFGPSAAGAQIEASKEFSKKFMIRHGIPTAKFESFTDPDKACEFIISADFEALVVKASGLAAGKGVVVASTRAEACKAAKEMLTEKVFGAAGDVVVVEELLQGPEVSILAFSDGQNVHLMPPAQDHKRLLDQDEGPNTGGMGAVCPYPGLSETDLEDIKKNVIEKTVRGLAQEGVKYIGVLYAGLMLTKDGPKVLEFNCRFGDPETQSILSLLTSDLLPTLKSCVNGSLLESPPVFDTHLSAVGVVVVSGGYPGSYKKGIPIHGLEEIAKSGVRVFHAGTAQSSTNSQVVTSGGRVVAVVATEPSLNQARQRATQGAYHVKFEGAFYRKDIGSKILSRAVNLSSGQTGHEVHGLLYKEAGVDIMAGDALVQIIKPLAKRTRRSGCDADLGGFGGLFDLKAAGLDNSLLACVTKGMGRKLQFAGNDESHYNIGLDLVAQCTNGLLNVGAEPIFFLDYLAVGKLDIKKMEHVIRGMSDGCLQAGCALIGGETAEMPGMYGAGAYDGVGMAVGAVAHPKPPAHDEMCRGDVLIALETSALQHGDMRALEDVLTKNDFEAREMKGFHGGATLADDILIPTTPYASYLIPLMKASLVKKFDCASDSLSRSLARIAPAGLIARLNPDQLRIGPLHNWMARMSQFSPMDLTRVCSCGIAAILVVGPENVAAVVKELTKCGGTTARAIGEVVERKGEEEQMTVSDLPSSVKEGNSAAQIGLQQDLAKIMDLAHRPGAMASLGNLPGRFDLCGLDCVGDKVLVSGSDGVGTKLKVAQEISQHSTIGQDLVAMCVNDVLASGADPLFFTSYLGCGLDNPDWLNDVVKGVAYGCQLAGCALVEQEFTVLPSIYDGNHYDLAGFSVAVVEKASVLPRLAAIKQGDAVIGLTSSGVHSNGFSLVRRVLEINKFRLDMPSPFKKGVTLGQDLLTPTRIYVKAVLPAMRHGKIKSFAHITGGGLVENIPRVMSPDLQVCLDANAWTVHPVFGWLQYWGKISETEMARTFNCGLGAVMIVDQSEVADVISQLSDGGETPVVVGSVVQGHGVKTPRVRIENLQSRLESSWRRPTVLKERKRVGVLISGSGTNLQALIDYTRRQENNSAAEISLVISNKAGVKGLARAQQAMIPSMVIDHKKYSTREDFDGAVHEALMDHNIQLVCLAGFMRILTGGFVSKWTGRMLNIHPSLLPSFKGAHAHRLALEAGVRISGCTVHFVAEEVDAGAILVQETMPVYPGDTESMLSERIKGLEHAAFPAALEMVASERVELDRDGKLIWNW